MKERDIVALICIVGLVVQLLVSNFRLVTQYIEGQSPSLLWAAIGNGTMMIHETKTTNSLLRNSLVSLDNMPSSTTSSSSKALPTIVVQLRGEMGNHLSTMAHGYGLQLELQRVYGIETQLILRHQMTDGVDNPKWLSSSRTFKQCFPKLRSLDYSQANTAEFDQRLKQITQVFSTKEQQLLDGINGKVLDMYEEITDDHIRSSLEFFLSQFRNQTRQSQLALLLPPNATISLPFLRSWTLASNYMINKYYTEIRDWFQFETHSACCRDLPDPNEVVFVRMDTKSPNDLIVVLHQRLCLCPCFILHLDSI